MKQREMKEVGRKMEGERKIRRNGAEKG